MKVGQGGAGLCGEEFGIGGEVRGVAEVGKTIEGALRASGWSGLAYKLSS